MNRWILLAIVIFAIVDATAAERCPSCHDQQKATASHPECQACHGSEHDDQMASRARRNQACLPCHSAQSGSYLLSKHGVIATFEGEKSSFSQPLQDGNYRAPTCAYCHFHQGNHTLSRAELRFSPCRECHAPRYVETWFASGDRMVELGWMKVREGAAVLQTLEEYRTGQNEEAQTIYQNMKNKHLVNIRLGVGHQSPDDQWWHGHPALDGDLLRLKSILSDHLRAGDHR